MFRIRNPLINTHSLPLFRCTADQLEILWLYRHYLSDYSALLPWILQAAHGWDWACLSEIYCLLKEWSSLQPMQALELLLPQ